MEKIEDAMLPPASNGPFGIFTSNSVAASLSKVYIAFSERRAALGLSNPGTVDGVGREVQRDVFLNNLMFSGFRADLTKNFSAAPLFQTAHNFAMGAQGLAPYTFAALYGSHKVFLQGNIDNDLSLNARANYRWSSAFVTKSSIGIGPALGGSSVQLEGDYTGADFTLNLKAMNPSILEGPLTGMFVGDYLQAVTPRLALGVEALYSRQTAEEGPSTMLAYALRYRAKDWIGSAQLLANGAVNTSYWRRLSDRVEAGVDVSLQFAGLSGAGMMGPSGNEGVATLGAKYEFRTAIFRGQIDSKGRVSCVLEKMVSQPVQVTFAGELDHVKNTAKVGLAISLQSADEELNMRQERGEVVPVTPPF